MEQFSTSGNEFVANPNANRRMTKQILEKAEAGLYNGGNTLDSSSTRLNDSREISLMESSTPRPPVRLDMNKLAMALAPIAMNALPLTLSSNPLQTLTAYITEIKKNPKNPELIAMKYLKVFTKKSVYSINSKNVATLLPNVNLRTEKSLPKHFGINKMELVDITNQKDAVYTVKPYQYILAVMVNSARYDDFDKRIDFAFKMYDHNDDGKIDRKDLRDMLVNYAKDDNLKVEDSIIEELADAIVTEMSVEGRGEYATPQDFRNFLNQYKSKDVKIGVFEKDSARISVFKPVTPLTTETLDSLNSKKTALIQMEIERPQKKQKGKLSALRTKLKLDGIRLFWMFAWGVMCLYLSIGKFIAIYGATKYISLGFAKSMGILLNFNICILILLANKAMNTLLRLAKLSFIMPLDTMITFHKLVAKWIFIFSAAHTICHCFVDLPLLSFLSIEDLNKMLMNKLPEQHKWWWWIFLSLPGWTGLLACVFFLVLGIGTIKKNRKANFEAFWYSHKLWIPSVIVLSLHGQAKLLGAPQFLIWVAFPTFMMTCDKLYTLYLVTLSKPLRIRNLEFLESGVIELKLTKPKDFKFICGQYALVNVPALSKLQWHPFSISSSKRDPYFTFHIAPAGDWTNSLKKLAQDLKKLGPSNSNMPPVYIQGPYGAPSQTYDSYKHLIIITTGVGATPFSSILRRLNQKANEPNSNFKTTSVDFYWVNRKPSSHTWMNGLLQDLQSNEKFKSILNINIFLTSLHAKYDLRSLLLWRGLAILTSKGKVVKGLDHFNVVHWGRPDWNQIFRKKAAEYPKGTQVGVFFCGNKDMGAKLFETSEKHSGNVIFEFHREVF